jgi:hypothetical protein
MSYAIDVPRDYRSGRVVEYDTSDCERYVDGYEQGWWHCVRLYRDDIDYQFRATDCMANGWESFIVGSDDGFGDAHSRVQGNIRRFGKRATHEHLVALSGLK